MTTQSQASRESHTHNLQSLKRSIDTAKNMTCNFDSYGRATSSHYAEHSAENSAEQSSRLREEGDSKEEMIRRRTVVLTSGCPYSPYSCNSVRYHQVFLETMSCVWGDCVGVGALRDASMIMSRHLSAVMTSPTSMNHNNDSVALSEHPLSCTAVMKAFRNIPGNVSPNDLVSWLRADILPRLHLWTVDHSFQNLEGSRLDSLLVAELCRRASLSAERLGNPFEALMVADLAVTLSSSFSDTSEQEGESSVSNEKSKSNIGAQCRVLLRNLQIQGAVWMAWGETTGPSLSDVTQMGLCGLVRERLWTLPDSEERIREDVVSAIEPVLEQFGVRLDDVLQSWVADAAANRIVTVREDSSRDTERDRGCVIPSTDEEEEETTCTLSRLVSVVGLIKSARLRVSSLLLLFQVPAVDHGEGYGDENASAEHSSSPSVIPSDKAAKKENSAVERLCALAHEACSQVPPTIAESLVEAVRLLRIKTLAASYGVKSFDPRDRHQIRAVANVIALKAQRTYALRDAMEFASSWGTDSADLSGERKED